MLTFWHLVLGIFSLSGCPPVPAADFFTLIGTPLFPNAHRRKSCETFGVPRTVPRRPAFGVKPCVRSRLGPKGQDHGTWRFGPAAPCAATWGGWRRMLVQPLNDATLERP